MKWLMRIFGRLRRKAPISKPVDKPVESVEKPVRELPDVDYKFKPKLGLIVGHERSAPGAIMVTTKQSEYFWNDDLAKRVKRIADEQRDMIVEIVYRDGVGREGAAKKVLSLKCDVAMELHFNSFSNPAVRGTEVLSSTYQRDMEFAAHIQKALVECLGRKKADKSDRGVKVLKKGDRAATNVYLMPEIPNCLPEFFFGSSPEDCHLANEKKQDIAQALHDAVLTWFKVD